MNQVGWLIRLKVIVRALKEDQHEKKYGIWTMHLLTQLKKALLQCELEYELFQHPYICQTS